MAHKTPHRSNRDVTQSFNDGILTVYSEADEAVPGYKPKVKQTKKHILRYEERKLGIQRRYLSLQNQMEIARVVRVPKVAELTTQDTAETEDGQRYRIALIQMTPDVFPPCLDLSLTVLKQKAEEKKETDGDQA